MTSAVDSGQLTTEDKNALKTFFFLIFNALSNTTKILFTFTGWKQNLKDGYSSKPGLIQQNHEWIPRELSKKKEIKWVHPTTEQIFQHLYEENLEVPGIKALLSTGVAEALLVATGLAGVGARALWLLLDGDWRAVKCHRYRRQQTEKRVGKHTHTHREQDLYIPFSLSPAPILQLLSSKGKSKYSCLHRNLFYVPAKMLK